MYPTWPALLIPLLPPPEYVPAAQVLHTVLEFAPTAADAFPAAQSVHVLMLCAPVLFEYVPAGHRVHAEAPGLSLRRIQSFTFVAVLLSAAGMQSGLWHPTAPTQFHQQLPAPLPSITHLLSLLPPSPLNPVQLPDAAGAPVPGSYPMMVPDVRMEACFHVNTCWEAVLPDHSTLSSSFPSDPRQSSQSSNPTFMNGLALRLFWF